MKLTSGELLKMKIIDEVIKEPAGGAHRNKEQTILLTKNVIIQYLDEFKNYTKEEIIKQRREKFLNIGKEKTLTVFSKKSNWILRNNFFNIIKKFKKELIVIVLLIAAITFLI